MIKIFCDICEREINGDNRCSANAGLLSELKNPTSQI